MATSHASVRPIRRAALEKGTPPRLCEMQSLNHKALQRRERGCFVSRALQDFFHADNRDDEPTTAQRRQKPPRRTVFAGSCFAQKKSLDFEGHGTTDRPGIAGCRICST